MTTPTMIPQTASMATLLTAMLNAGYEVTFTRGADGIYTAFANLLGVDGGARLADAATPYEALEGAAPEGMTAGPLRFSDDVLDERVTDLEEAVTRLDERTGANQELLIRTLGNAVTMLMDSGLWTPGETTDQT